MIPAWPIVICLIVSLAGLLTVALAPHLRSMRRAWFAIAAAIAILYGGGKTPYVFSFELGLSDAGSSYDAAEGVLVAKWTASEALAGYKFRWTYSIDGGDHVELPEGMVADGEARAVIERGIESLHVVCWAEYVPPVVVVTNGVYHLSGVMRTMDGDERWVTPAVPVIMDGEQIAPPAGEPAILHTIEE